MASKRKRSDGVHKTWRFTLNNYTPVQEATIKSWAPESVNHLVVSREVGESGTPHLQGYVTFTASRRLAALKKLLTTAHWEPALVSDGGLYEKKEGSELIIDFHAAAKGRRTDIEVAYSSAKDGLSVAEFMEQQKPNFQALRVFEKASLVLGPKKTTNKALEVHWISGGTGTGKTRFAYATDPELYPSLSFKWWDGYDTQRTILIDDYRKDYCKFHELLRLLDIYPQRKEIKGGSVMLKHTAIMITTPKTVDETWEGRTTEDLNQLKRRITHEWRFQGDGLATCWKRGEGFGRDFTVEFDPDGSVTVTEVGEGNTDFPDDLAWAEFGGTD